MLSGFKFGTTTACTACWSKAVNASDEVVRPAHTDRVGRYLVIASIVLSLPGHFGDLKLLDARHVKPAHVGRL